MYFENTYVDKQNEMFEFFANEEVRISDIKTHVSGSIPHATHFLVKIAVTPDMWARAAVLMRWHC